MNDLRYRGLQFYSMGLSLSLFRSSDFFFDDTANLYNKSDQKPSKMEIYSMNSQLPLRPPGGASDCGSLYL